jgi:hypothetical protein
MTPTDSRHLQVCLADDPAFDQPPVAFWWRFSIDDVVKEEADATAKAGSCLFILATGCGVPGIEPHGNIVTSCIMVEEST